MSQMDKGREGGARRRGVKKEGGKEGRASEDCKGKAVGKNTGEGNEYHFFNDNKVKRLALTPLSKWTLTPSFYVVVVVACSSLTSVSLYLVQYSYSSVLPSTKMLSSSTPLSLSLLTCLSISAICLHILVVSLFVHFGICQFFPCYQCA